MLKSTKRLLIEGLFLFICTCIYLLFTENRLDVYVMSFDNVAEENVTFDKDGIVEIEKIEKEDDIVKMTFHALKAGEVSVTVKGQDDVSGNWQEQILKLQVDHFLSIYDKSNLNFTRYKGIVFFWAVFFLIAAGIMFTSFCESAKSNLYSYRNIYYAGFGFFVLSVGVVLSFQLFQCCFSPCFYTMANVYTAISEAGATFMLLTFPFLLIFSVSMCISNLSLLYHEGASVKNVCGILISVLTITGEVIGFLVDYNFTGSEFQYRIHLTVYSLYTTMFVYFECMFLGAVLCGLAAAIHRPKPDKDYIVILGCGIRKDGSLLPLLRGRVDCAVDFYQKQLKETGKKAIFVPSGGQGSDEVISEAEAMKRYLVSKGFSEEQILLEDQSKNTLQNMKFSKEKIERRNQDAKVAFSTTNYHVFRSGILARKAGFMADGMGSRTKWYFWPNAFVREFVGMLFSEKKKQIALVLVLLLIFSGIAIIIPV